MLVITWVYGLDNFCLDIRLMLKRDVHTYWKICWQYVSPALLSFVLVATMASWKRSSLDGVVFPAWTNAIALVLIFSSILFIPGMAIHHIVKKGGIKVSFFSFFHMWVESFTPTHSDLGGNPQYHYYFRPHASQQHIGVHYYQKIVWELDMKIVQILILKLISVSGHVVDNIF